MELDDGQRPNLWALSLMELMAENLSLHSEELDHAYRQCPLTSAEDSAWQIFWPRQARTPPLASSTD
jgi:hypothetical protein